MTTRIKWTPQNIRGLRSHMRMTQAVFAVTIKRGRTTVAAWETGAKHPDVDSQKVLDDHADAQGFSGS